MSIEMSTNFIRDNVRKNNVGTVVSILLLIAAMTACADSSGKFPLVDGARQAVIVSGKQDSKEHLAWRYVGLDCDAQAVMNSGGGMILKKWIMESTGRNLDIIPESQFRDDKTAFPIYVGGTAKAKELFGDRLKTLDTDGYIVHVTPEFAVLAGNVDYAEFDFLRNYLGVDAYLPINLFIIAPKCESVLIQPETRIELPVFFSRAFSGLGTDTGENVLMKEFPWRLQPGMGNGRYKFHHNIHNFITVAEFGKDHPEYFPLIGDKRVVVSGSDKAGPCLSNPEVVKIIIRKCREYFDKNPDAIAISLGMPDVGAGKWCECPECKSADGPSINVGGKTSPRSNRYYTFLNKVAKAIQDTHPGKCIGTLGYLGTDRPPSFPLEPNIIVYMCYSRANWCNPTDKTADLELTNAWLESVKLFGIYEYMYGMGFSIPRLYTRQLAEFLRHVGNKRPGSGFYAEVYSNHGLDGPKSWIVEKLLWNPNQDVDRLMNQWAKACFGPAAEPMKKYFDLLEEAWMRNGAAVKPTGILWGFRQERQYEMLRPDDLPALWKLLDEAKTKGGADEMVQQRINYFATTFKISDVDSRRYHAFSEAAKLMNDKAAPDQVLAALLRHAPEAPVFPLEDHIRYVWDKVPKAYSGNGQPMLAVKAMQYVCESVSWRTVGEMIKNGERSPSKLVQEAQASLLKLAPAGYENDVAAKALMDRLLKMVDRIALAKRNAKPPVIDGNPDEVCWNWVDHNPWTLLNSGDPAAYRTLIAWTYDDDNLYFAVRCFGQADKYAANLKPADAMTGCSPGRFPSIELHIVTDAGDAKKPPYQIGITMKGGVWESGGKALAGHKTSEPEPETWQAELALSWKQLGIDPGQTAALRLNLKRNLRTRFVPSVSSWYTTFAPNAQHDEGQAKPSFGGWLILER